MSDKVREPHEWLRNEDYYEYNTVGSGRRDYSCDHCGGLIKKGDSHHVHKFYPEFASIRTHIKCSDEFKASLRTDADDEAEKIAQDPNKLDFEGEMLSEYIHEQMWLPWAKEIASTEKLSPDRLKRWTEECFRPYRNLSAEMKDKDRDFAKGILEILTDASNSYINDRKAIDRLKSEYGKYKNLVIGFDFDCTIFDYHKEELDITPIILLLRRCSKAGLTMCLYTLTPDGSLLKDKLDYTISKGIRIDYINASNILTEQSTVAPSKPFFSILLDDRAGLASAYKILSTTLDELGL